MRTSPLVIVATLTACSSFSATIVRPNDDAGVGGSSNAGGQTSAGAGATSVQGGATNSVNSSSDAPSLGGVTSAGGSPAVSTASGGANAGGTTSASDAAVGGPNNTVDAAAGAYATGGCDLSQSFGTPFQVVPSSLTSDESGISVSVDGLVAIVAINPGGTGSNSDLKLYTRDSVVVPFENQQELPGASKINTSNDDTSPRLSRDGLNLFYSICHPGGCDIYLATRTSPNASFGSYSPLPSNINLYSASAGAWISPDNTDFYWDSADTIYHATIYNGAFEAATLISELVLGDSLNGPPVLTDDQLSLYFASDRAGATGTDVVSYFRIWKSMRTNKNASWNAPSLVTELDQGSGAATSNQAGDVSPDGCTIYLSSQVGTHRHLFQASKPR